MADERYDPNRGKKYSLSTPQSPKPTTPLSQASSKPVSTSTFLTRIANTAIRESGGQPPAPQGPRFMSSSIDHSSPQANLASRLKWVESAFKPENVRPPLNHKMRAPEQMQQAQQAAPQVPQEVAQVTQHANQVAQLAVASATDFKSAVELMRRRMQTLRSEMEQLDRELAEIHSKMQ